jgi:hypothetical protein
MIRKISIFTIVILLLAVHGRSLGADANPDWERVVGAAKKEGKVIIGAPPGSDFRNEVQATLKKRFDLDSEFIQAPGPSLMSKIVAEKQAGLVSVDAFFDRSVYGELAAQGRSVRATGAGYDLS